MVPTGISTVGQFSSFLGMREYVVARKVELFNQAASDIDEPHLVALGRERSWISGRVL